MGWELTLPPTAQRLPYQHVPPTHTRRVTHTLLSEQTSPYIATVKAMNEISTNGLIFIVHICRLVNHLARV